VRNIIFLSIFLDMCFLQRHTEIIRGYVKLRLSDSGCVSPTRAGKNSTYDGSDGVIGTLN